MKSKMSFKVVATSIWNVVSWVPTVLFCICLSIVHGTVEIIKDAFIFVKDVFMFIVYVAVDLFRMIVIPRKLFIHVHKSLIPQRCSICNEFASKKKGKIIFLVKGERFVHRTCRDEELRKEAEERRNRVNNSPYGEELAELLLSALLSK